MKKLGKLKLKEKEIIARLSNGEMKYSLGGSQGTECLLAGCGQCSSCQSACAPDPCYG
jgi:natural product precursor